MANRKVAVYKQVSVGGVWVKCPPYIHPKNHRVENDKVLVKGKMEVHPEGDWGIFYYEGTKRKWKKIGPKYEVARRAAETKELALNARAVGHEVKEAGDNKTRLRAAIDLFLDDIKTSRRPKTHQLLSYDLGEFADWVKKEYVEDITRKDLLAYKAHILSTPEVPRSKAPHTSLKLRSERTAANKVGEVNQFHRWFMKIDPGKGLITMKDLKTTAKEVEIYEEDELKAFFGSCSTRHRLMFKTFLQSGLRKQEMQFLEWPNVDFVGGVIQVREKLKSAIRPYEFRPKTHEERDVSVPQELLNELAMWKLTAKNQLVFPTRSGQADKKIWEAAERIGKKAGLESPAFVHKFRATFASTCLQRGMDLASVQAQLGHKDLESTMRYLAGLKKLALRTKVESVWAPTAEQVQASRQEILDRELEDSATWEV
jgi:integrase/recombinase XerD